MSATATEPTAATQLHLLVFGPPDSGKSSLLGALAQAATAQQALLKGQLADDSGKLAELRKLTYAGTPPAAAGEVTPYALRFAAAGDAPRTLTTMLLDTDGALAEQYLAGKRRPEPRDSRLARAMFDADAVICTFDVSAANPAERLAALAQWLTLLQEARARRVDVADLPVYLVLTKCDTLAKSDDTFSRWLERMEDAKRKIDERLSTLLPARADTAPFGTIDLQLWATAIGRPALADRPAAAEPCGVAELFRQCFASAEAFDRREHRASRRLEWTIGGLGFLVVMLGLLGGLFAATQPDTVRTRLEEQLQSMLPEPDASADRRLRAPLQERLDQLEKLQEDPAYEKLPSATREAVRAARDEWASYLKTRRDFQAAVKLPYLAKNEEEFTRFEQQARDFAMPGEYAAAWRDTALSRQLDKTRREHALVRVAVADKVDWIRARIDEGKKLDDQAYSDILPKLLKADKQARDQLTRSWFTAFAVYRQQPPYHRPADEAVPHVTSFIYADLDKFHEVREARKRWDKVRRDIDETHDLVTKKVAAQ